MIAFLANDYNSELTFNKKTKSSKLSMNIRLFGFDVLPALKDGDSFGSLRKDIQRTVPADGLEAPCKGTATPRLTAQAMRSC